ARLTSGWRNADYADLHADYADGFLHRSGGRLWWRSGEVVVRSMLRGVPFRGQHAVHGAPRTFPRSVLRSGGQGVRPTRRQSDLLLLRSTRARTAQRSSGGNAVHTNYSIPAETDALISGTDPSA